MKLEMMAKHEVIGAIAQKETETVDFLLLITSALEIESKQQALSLLGEASRVLKQGGLLFVEGMNEYLPILAAELDRLLDFKYWIVLESEISHRTAALPNAHNGLLLFSKGQQKFHVKRIRSPHEICQACGDFLRDWGGKKHLMHPEGTAVSDIWKSNETKSKGEQISRPTYERLLSMLDFETDSAVGIIAPREGISSSNSRSNKSEWWKSSKKKLAPARIGQLKSTQVNKIIQGDAVKSLKKLPANSVDLVFADPPYNLEKKYSAYKDEVDADQYLEWCNEWLREYARILKPTGSLFVLNLPKWSIHHAVYLNQYLHFQNWIVWDALAEPRGKLLPAHYSLLYYTKSPNGFKFNYSALQELPSRDYCLRNSCVRSRSQNGHNKTSLLTDLWWDVHRIKHKKDRDPHPCQLPESLLERIISLSTDQDDVVVDAMVGAGTTAMVAHRLGRKFIGIDLDKDYVAVARKKLNQLDTHGHLHREKTVRPRDAYTKKEIQLELKDLARQLGRLPQPQDIQGAVGRFSLEDIQDKFPSWSKAVKAAKVEIEAKSWMPGK